MNKIIGEIKNNKIIVKRKKEIGRLYNKSHLGKTLSGNILQLELLEGLFLLGEEKIRIFQNKLEIDFQKLIELSAKKIPHLEIKYLVFRDLRKRGNIVKIHNDDKNFEFFILLKEKNKDKKMLIKCFSERDNIKINSIETLIEEANKNQSNLWFAIVDEEGDITYYDVSQYEIQGNIKENKYNKKLGVLLENRVILFDKYISEKLFEKEFYGKPFGSGLQLSLIESLYLMQRNIIDIKHPTNKNNLSINSFKTILQKIQPDFQMRSEIFQDLKKRGLIIKTGYKYGAHFRAYTKKPQETHAEFLINVVDKKFRSTWAEISRAVRLAHSVNKEILYARIDNGDIYYIKFGRLRP